jgi:hypothetical protein
MWGPLAVGALVTALHPVRLAVVALLISRPRPLANLFAYWLGAVGVGVPSLLIPLLVLHSTPAISSFAQHIGASSTFRHIQVGMGVLAISLAALMILRYSARQRMPVWGGRHRMPAQSGNTSTLVLDQTTPPTISRLLGHSADAAESGGSPIRRLLGRANNAWEGGSPWVAGLLGALMGGPSIDGVALVIAFIATSGSAIGTQVCAAIAVVFGILLVEEAILLSSLVAPARTQSVLRVVRQWVQSHRRKMVVTLFALAGVALVAQGTGAI